MVNALQIGADLGCFQEADFARKRFCGHISRQSAQQSARALHACKERRHTRQLSLQ